jgi:hypothetical protein
MVRIISDTYFFCDVMMEYHHRTINDVYSIESYKDGISQSEDTW